MHHLKPFFSLYVWLKVYQLWWSFQRSNFWFNLSFLLFFFVSISFISAFIFLISFLLLILGFICSYSFSYFRCTIRLFILAFSSFLWWDCIAINFPLRTAFTMSHWIWIVICSFPFVSKYLLISSLISSMIHFLFCSILFSLKEFAFFCCIFLVFDI